MRNVIFPTFPRRPSAQREGRRTFPDLARGRNEGDCPWMNRRNDRAIIRGKERGIFEIKRSARRSDRRRNLHTKCIYVYGMYVPVNAYASLKFRRFEPFRTRARPPTIFPGAVRTGEWKEGEGRKGTGRGRCIPSLLRRKYSTTEFYRDAPRNNADFPERSSSREYSVKKDRTRRLGKTKSARVCSNRHFNPDINALI